MSTPQENLLQHFRLVTLLKIVLKKRGTGIKVSLFKRDLEGSKTFDTEKRTFQTSSKYYDSIIKI
ncbi:MAG: hypothetical protein RMY29_006980 [Nostoc sp. CreGUA01]|nr:hypothetical protein [Nostoc sp. CreGUA01]